MFVRSPRHAAALLAVFAVLAPLTTATGIPEASGRVGPSSHAYELVGHRGYVSRDFTENTIASVRRADRAGASAVEVDLSLTSDRGVILMHDATLNRTTDCGGPVFDRTRAEIVKNCKSVPGGEKVATLGGLLNWAQDANVHLILEIKDHRDSRWEVEDFTRVHAQVQEHGLADRVIYLSERPQDLATLDRAAPAAHLQFIVASWRQVKQARKWADGLNVHAAQLTRARVTSLHRDGILVLGRGTQQRSDWQRYLNVGVDGVMIDDIDAYQRWRKGARRS